MAKANLSGNPIIADLRDYWAHHGPKLTSWHAAEYLNICDIDGLAKELEVSPEELKLARTVLERLFAIQFPDHESKPSSGNLLEDLGNSILAENRVANGFGKS